MSLSKFGWGGSVGGDGRTLKPLPARRSFRSWSRNCHSLAGTEGRPWTT